MALTVKNWTKHQHFTRRRPPWIKLHYDLLDKGKFQDLPVESRALLPMIWLLASEHPDGRIDRANEDIAKRLHWPLIAYLDACGPLIWAGFVVPDEKSKDEILIRQSQVIENTAKSPVTARKRAVSLNKPSESQRIRGSEYRHTNRDTESLGRANKENGEDQISGDGAGLFDDDASLGDATALAVEIWNDMAGKVGLPGKVMRLTGPRRAKVLARLRELGGLEGWKAMVALVAESDFLCGRKQGSEWQVPFDFVLKPQNVTKIMEGNYGNKKPNGRAATGTKPSRVAIAHAGIDAALAAGRERDRRQAELDAARDHAEPEGAGGMDDDY